MKEKDLTQECLLWEALQKGETDEKLLAALRAKHGALYFISVEDKSGLCKKPDRKTLSAFMSVSQKDPLRANEILLKNCMLAGDAALIEDDDYFLSASAQLAELIEIKQGELKKL